MTRWSAETSMPPDWPRVCRQENYLFHSPEWMKLLERSFGCSSIYATDHETQLAAGISIFRAGPFRVGYVGFPVGGLVGEGSLSGDVLDQLRSAIGRNSPVCMRIPVSGFSDPVALDLPYDATPETAIVDLQSWSLAKVSTNRRRDVKRSLASGLEFVDAKDPCDGERLFDLYYQTIRRNRGAVRYNATYFAELIRFADQCSNMRVLLAKSNDSIAGFTVAAINRSVGYYLHGAFDWDLREHRPAAMLMAKVIDWAKREGCHVFNFMSSPPSQVSLTKYKEQWGAETREHRTYTLPVKSTYVLFKAAERLYRVFR